MRFHQDDQESKEFHHKCRTVAIYVFVSLVAVALFSLLIFKIKSVLAAFSILLSAMTVIFYGIFIACVLFPFFTLFNRLFSMIFKKSARLAEVFALICTYVSLFGVLTIILFSVIPSFGQEVTSFIDAVKAALANANSLLSKNESLAFLKDVFSDIGNALLNKLITPETIYSYVMQALSGAYNVIIGLIISIYLLTARKKLGALGNKVMISIFPKKFVTGTTVIFRSFYHGFMEFFFARLLLSAALAALTYVFCFVLGIPFRGIIMLILLFTGIVPFAGPIIGTLVCFFLVLLIDPTHALILFLFIVVVHILEGHFLKKRLLRPALRPGAAITSISVIIGYALFSFVGAILAVPVYAALSLNLRDYEIRHLLRRGYRIEDQDLVHHTEDEQITFMDNNQE